MKTGKWFGLLITCCVLVWGASAWAAQGKPVVFPGLNQSVRKQDGFKEDSSAKSLLQMLILEEARLSDWDELRLRLDIVKLLKELGLFTREDWNNLLVVLAENLDLRRKIVIEHARNSSA